MDNWLAGLATPLPASGSSPHMPPPPLALSGGLLSGTQQLQLGLAAGPCQSLWSQKQNKRISALGLPAQLPLCPTLP